jgi:hypothetical protein
VKRRRYQSATDESESWSINFLTDADLHRTVTIRHDPLSVHDALHRSLAHVSYHIREIVYVAHSHGGDAWANLSIPPGGSAAYNATPTLETPQAHVATLSGGEIGDA